MGRATIERNAFDPAMGPCIDFATRCFVHAARLHADEAVFDQIQTADAMLAAEVVKSGQ